MQRLFVTAEGDPVSAATGGEARQLIGRVSTASGLGMASMVEAGARSLLHYMFSREETEQGPVLLIAGRGYSGAIVFSLARHLANNGVRTVVCALTGSGPEEHLRQRSAYRQSNGRLLEGVAALAELNRSDDDAYPLLIDGLLGGGVYGAPDPELAEMLTLLAARTSRDRQGRNGDRPTVIALDIPSGVDPTTGVCSAAFVTADVTAAMGFPRTGGFAAVCGTMIVVDIGISPHLLQWEGTLAYPCRFRRCSILTLESFT